MSSSIITEAHSWLGTRFKHQGRIKKTEEDLGGCDCLGFIMGVGIKTKNNQNLSKFDQANYPKLVTSNIVLEKLNTLLESVPITEIAPGDILLIRTNNWPQHLVLVVEKTESSIIIIHSYIQARKVVKQYLSEEWFHNIVAVYRSYNR